MLSIDQFGGILIGSVIGWIIVYTMRKQAMDWKIFGELVLLIVGGNSLPILAEKNLHAYFWVGIFAGFFANIISKLLLPALEPTRKRSDSIREIITMR